VIVRHGRREDAAAIQALYKAVAATPGGIARTPHEVTREYVDDFIAHSLARGIILVAEFPDSTRLAGELHAYRSELENFSHVMGDLTIAIHPDAQRQGLGRRLFTQLLEEVARDHPHVTRVELVTQEDNERALRLYESVGFKREGRFEGRIRGANGALVADIPMGWLRQA
jgi:ribosomal protein S18 acetylase RimI-like enzyme